MRAWDVRVRLVFSLLIALGGLAIEPRAAWPAVWLAASVAAQMATFAVSQPMRRAEAGAASPRRKLAFFAMVAVNASIVASAGPLFWFSGGWGERVFALIILAGGAVNVAMQAGTSARLLWIGCAPFMVLLPALPLISLPAAAEAERGALGLCAFAGALFVGHLISAGQHSLVNARKLARALQEAQDQRLRAERASQAKSDFLGVMTHELRTPLNGVLGMVQAMDGDRLTREQRRRLGVIRQSGETLLMLLNDVLDISRIETAELELRQEVIDVGALALQAEAVFRPLAEAKALRFQVRLLKSAERARLGDAERVRQVLHNLLGEAVRVTDAGGVTAIISGGADELVFDVSDSGPGQDAGRLRGLFDPFERFGASAAHRPDGSGLGLGVARGLARLMGGDVTVRSEPKGSTFTARLKLPTAAAPAAPAVEPAAAQRVVDARLRVLAAEDNPTNQLVLRTLLDQLGVAVHIVADGAEAVAAWSESSWDLVLMDIRMPVMDGFAATRAIRAREAAERRARTPIIALTADARAQEAAEYTTAGMDGLAPKPIQLAQLLSVLQSVLAPRPDESQARPARSAA